MITYKSGDLFESGAEALVNPVNCAGVMGSGLAREFRRRFPEVYLQHRIVCRQRSLRPGIIHTVELFEPSVTVKYIFNFPTKDRWQERSKLVYIETGLFNLIRAMQDLCVKSIAIPALGAGLGGLPWNDVRDLIERILGPLESVDILVYEPH